LDQEVLWGLERIISMKSLPSSNALKSHKTSIPNPLEALLGTRVLEGISGDNSHRDENPTFTQFP
jgi:hypothetical protein